MSNSNDIPLGSVITKNQLSKMELDFSADAIVLPDTVSLKVPVKTKRKSSVSTANILNRLRKGKLGGTPT